MAAIKEAEPVVFKSVLWFHACWYNFCNVFHRNEKTRSEEENMCTIERSYYKFSGCAYEFWVTVECLLSWVREWSEEGKSYGKTNERPDWT